MAFDLTTLVHQLQGTPSGSPVQVVKVKDRNTGTKYDVLAITREDAGSATAGNYILIEIDTT